MLREIKVQDAVGRALAHDVTRIVPGEYKGVLFHRGHIIETVDIESLLSIGKEHIYVIDDIEERWHEDDAARHIGALVAHESLTFREPHEGKVQVEAVWDGLWQVDPDALLTLNLSSQLAFSTRRTLTKVKAGERVASIKTIPLFIDPVEIKQVEQVVRALATPLFTVKPFMPIKVAVVTTGSEVAKGRIEDKFGPALQKRFIHYPIEWLGQTIVGDEREDIVRAMNAYIEQGAQMVLVTGGMSVDPDDRSPGAIRQIATEVITYGTPILPGAMTMLAYHHDIVLMGLPGGVIYDEHTAFDHLLPIVLAGIRPDKRMIASFGHGGLFV